MVSHEVTTLLHLPFLFFTDEPVPFLLFAGLDLSSPTAHWLLEFCPTIRGQPPRLIGPFSALVTGAMPGNAIGAPGRLELWASLFFRDFQGNRARAIPLAFALVTGPNWNPQKRPQDPYARKVSIHRHQAARVVVACITGLRQAPYVHDPKSQLSLSAKREQSIRLTPHVHMLTTFTKLMVRC